jgi:hypothetical protein
MEVEIRTALTFFNEGPHGTYSHELFSLLYAQKPSYKI